MVDVARACYIYYFDDVNCFALRYCFDFFALVQCHRENDSTIVICDVTKLQQQYDEQNAQ